MEGAAVREEGGLAALARRSVEEEPFTARELARGEAIRVVSCVRANDDDVQRPPSGFVWSVLLFRAPSHTGDAMVRLSLPSRLQGLLVGGSGDFASHGEGPLASRMLDIDGAAWVVSEHALPVSSRMPWFSIRSGRAVRPVDHRRRNELIRGYFERICNAAADVEGYGRWLEGHRRALEALEVPREGPLVSIVCPVFRTPPAYLRAMVDSVLAQTYPRWELVLVNASPGDEGVREVLAAFDDARIRVVDCPENRGIAANTNEGIARCTGDYVCFLDHDDVVEPQALAAMVTAAGGAEPADLLYCDEDSIDELGRYCIPLFKPGHNPDLLYSNDYVLHWLMVSRRALDLTRRSGPEVDGAQDYDLTLKVFELGLKAVRVPYVLYHWRIHEGSMNNNPDSKLYAQESGRRAIADHLVRRGVDAEVVRERVPSTYRADFAVGSDRPPLRCLVVGEPSERLRAAVAAFGGPSGTVESVSADAPAADIASWASAQKDGLVLFASGRLALDAASLETMAGYFSRPEVFAVSPRILLSCGLVDQAGCIVAPDGSLVSLGRCLPASDEGYIGRLHRPYDAAVLDADCCLVRASSLHAVGLDRSFCTVAYMLADACLSAFERGEANVYTPFATAEWETRRSLLEPGPAAPACDRSLLLSKHACSLKGGDPSHNPNFDPYSPHYRLGEADI